MLLDSYEPERIGFAQRLVATTDRAFTFVTADGPLADFVRTRLAPSCCPMAVRFETVREFMFRTVSQTMSTIATALEPRARPGDVHGGDRLPWVAVDGVDNYEPLTRQDWQVHVYGEASAAPRRLVPAP